MRFPNAISLPFQRAIVIVAGGRCVRYFLIHNQSLDELQSSCVEPLAYLDNEGLFARAGQGSVYGVGSVLESPKQEDVRRFIKTVTQELQDITKDHQEEKIILFAPKHLIYMIQDAFKTKDRAHLVTTIKGNFTQDSPITILKRLHQHLQKDHDFHPKGPEEERIQSTFEKMGRTN